MDPVVDEFTNLVEGFNWIEIKLEGNNINLYINSSDEDGRRYGVTSFNIDVVSGTEITLPENENRWSFTSNVLGTNSVKERTDAIVSAIGGFPANDPNSENNTWTNEWIGKNGNNGNTPILLGTTTEIDLDFINNINFEYKPLKTSAPIIASWSKQTRTRNIDINGDNILVGDYDLDNKPFTRKDLDIMKNSLSKSILDLKEHGCLQHLV